MREKDIEVKVKYNLKEFAQKLYHVTQSYHDPTLRLPINLTVES